MTQGTFRERLLRRELLLGTFIKTPSSHTTEVLAGTGLHFGIIDQEQGLEHGKAVCAHIGGMNPDEVDWLRSIGVSVFVVSSGQGLLRHAAREAVAEFGVLTESAPAVR